MSLVSFYALPFLNMMNQMEDICFESIHDDIKKAQINKIKDEISLGFHWVLIINGNNAIGKR